MRRATAAIAALILVFAVGVLILWSRGRGALDTPSGALPPQPVVDGHRASTVPAVAVQPPSGAPQAAPRPSGASGEPVQAVGAAEALPMLAPRLKAQAEDCVVRAARQRGEPVEASGFIRVLVDATGLRELHSDFARPIDASVIDCIEDQVWALEWPEVTEETTATMALELAHTPPGFIPPD